MNLKSFLIILCLIGLVLAAGCGYNAMSNNGNPIYVSKDPQACKSIKVECSRYNSDDYRWYAFSDNTGCGCKMTY